MTDSDYLSWFATVFQGNKDFYVYHQPPFHSDGKSKMVAKSVGYAKRDGEFLPVTEELYRNHLTGKEGLGVVPLTDDGKNRGVCFYAVIDIDVYGVNFTWLVKKLYAAGLKFAAFPSKSGGLHIYFFFLTAEPAADAVRALQRIVTVFGLHKLFASNGGISGKTEKSKVEIFPDKTVCAPGDAKPHGVFLPFYNAAGKSRSGLLTEENKVLQIQKARPVIDSMFTTVKEIEEVLDKLPYSDAPYCIQMLLLTGALGEGEGRNNFLFSAAVFLKKKYQDGFYDELAEMNNRLSDPMSEKDLRLTYNSVMARDYHYKCKEAPCASYCDRKECKIREFAGVKKDRKNTYTGADCWGEMSMVMAEEPYYLWQVRIKPDEEFKTVRADSVDDLQNQSVMQKRCWRDLHWAPFRVSDNTWIQTVNDAMEGIENRQIAIAKETDTSELSELRVCFFRFLTQAQCGAAHLVYTGRPYHGDGGYFFTHDGFKAYLTSEKLTLGRINLREWLISQGCSEAKVEWETGKDTKRTIACWKKPETEELLSMDEFYDDIYAGDAGALQEEARADDAPEEGRDDIRF
jgi:hypothetical protein